MFAPLLVLATACGGDSNDEPTAVPTNTQVTVPTEAAKPTEPAPGPGTVGNESLSFEGTDGVALRGHLYANSGPKRNVVILVSEIEQKTWAPHTADFVAKGVAVYTYDVRGKGETGGTQNEAMLDRDLEVAVRMLRSREYVRIYVIGIGAVGSNAAFTVAARQDLAGVGGVPASSASDVVSKVTEPKLFMVFDTHDETVERVNRAYQAAPQPAQLVMFPQPPSPDLDVLSHANVKLAILDFVSK